MLTFLLLEHDKSEAQNLMHFIKFVGERFLWVSDMKMAIEILMAGSIHLDALITALRVPKEREQPIIDPFGGIEIAHQARLYRPDLPVFFYASRGTVYHRSIINLPFDVGLIPRPARMEDFVTTSFALRHLKGGASYLKA